MPKLLRNDQWKYVTDDLLLYASVVTIFILITLLHSSIVTVRTPLHLFIVIVLTPLQIFIITVLTPLHLFIVIVLTSLHPFIVIVFTPFTHPQPIVMVHLAVACPGRHRQPYHWYIFSLHIQFTTISLIVCFHVVL